MFNFALTRTVLVTLVIINFTNFFNKVDAKIVPVKYNLIYSTNENFEPKSNISLNSKDLSVIRDTDEHETFVGRRKKHKKKKFMKYLYPAVVTAVVAKMILIPLILKALTAISSSSFVMSKVAMLTSAILVTRWLFDISKPKVEIVQVPDQKYASWDEREVKLDNKRYIPVGGGNSYQEMGWNYDNENGIHTPFL